MSEETFLGETNEQRRGQEHKGNKFVNLLFTFFPFLEPVLAVMLTSVLPGPMTIASCLKIVKFFRRQWRRMLTDTPEPNQGLVFYIGIWVDLFNKKIIKEADLVLLLHVFWVLSESPIGRPWHDVKSKIE